MSWLTKLMPARIRTQGGGKRGVPEGLWEKCDSCGTALYGPELERNLRVCPKCSHHMAIGARERLATFLDEEGGGEEIGAELGPVDALHFKDQKRYADRIKASQKSTGERDALVSVQGKLYGRDICVSAFEFRFMGGSMGSVVGERFTLAAERALEIGCPMVCFSATGGARMQESLFSLMQMAKTSAALGRLRAAGLPFVSVLTHPTTGGVSASLGMLGDLNVAEPQALIGFAGPRVIEQTVRETLPEGFQRSEFLVEHGAVDLIIDRRQMRERLAALLALMMRQPAPPPAEAEAGTLMSKRKYFGTDGIRGRVGEGPVSADFMLRLGRAAGRVLGAREGAATVVIGKDTRISGYMFEAALEAGLVAAGANVRMLGPMPTPAVAFLTRSLRADAGIVISASHNPHEDNGIKFFSAQGEKLDDAVEAEIEAELERPFATVPSGQLGKAVRIADALTRYAEFCKASVPDSFSLEGLKIALDCAHGATYQVAPKVFAELGASVSAIGVSPDGLNINRGVGSMHPEAIAAHVKATGSDLGIAFDGDGDRVLMVDGNGRLLDGDALIWLLAQDWRDSGRLRGPVVGTLMSNYALEHALGELRIPFQRAAVGDRFVHRALVEGGGVLGGEASGHLLCLDSATTGDAIVAALQVLEALVRQRRSLADALAGYQPLPQKTVNVRVAPGVRPLDVDSVQAARREAEDALAGRGRLVLRPSGTEPVVRVTVEAADAALMEQVLERLSTAVRAAV